MTLQIFPRYHISNGSASNNSVAPLKNILIINFITTGKAVVFDNWGLNHEAARKQVSLSNPRQIKHKNWLAF